MELSYLENRINFFYGISLLTANSIQNKKDHTETVQACHKNLRFLGKIQVMKEINSKSLIKNFHFNWD